MNRKIVAGNWKMNTLLESAIKLAGDVDELLSENNPGDVTVVLIPPYPFIHPVLDVIDRNKIKVGAQNCASEPKGAYTGEVSAEMIASTGAEYVIIGHSERREYFGENDEILSKKLSLALENDLTPIFCIGEKLEEREAGKQFEVVENQLKNTVLSLDEKNIQKLVIAYEPVWAIGTGKTATPEQAQEIHAFIRKLIGEKFGTKIANEIPVLYGGSVKPGNAKELFAKPDIDGGLIGGASLKAKDFVDIINSF
jgi:triosephosphate isomerase